MSDFAYLSVAASGFSEPEIIEAVKQGNTELVKAILSQDVAQRDACTPQDGATPLMFAAMLGHLDVVQLLVEFGCDINKQDNISGWTALMQATFHGKKAIAKYLISAGADVTVVEKTGCTAFDMASLLEDVDAELFRLLVEARAAQVNCVDQPSKKTNKLSAVKPDIVQTAEPHDSVSHSDVQPRTGFKAWWSRISNRFHNLKPESTSSKQKESIPSYDSTLKSTAVTSNNVDVPPRSGGNDPVNGLNKGTVDITRSQFDMAAMATAKSTVMFSLGKTTVLPPGGSRTVKPIVPPFFPPPSFQADLNMKMPPIGLRKPISGLGNNQTLMLSHSINTNAKLLQSTHSTLNLVNRVASPPPRVQFVNQPTAVSLSLPLDISPSASCNAATLDSSGGTGSSTARSLRSKVISSASSSTLTAGSDGNEKVKCIGGSQKKAELPPKNHKSSDNRHPLSRRSDRRHTAADIPAANLSSKDSASTLTPVQSPKHHAASARRNGSSVSSAISNSNPDDLESILQKLSLEQYQPIFEEQEVDMEAFLTLTNKDLDELGISNAESRRQILSAIRELNNSKDCERQRYQKVMASYADTMRSQRNCTEIPSADDCQVSELSASS